MFLERGMLELLDQDANSTLDSDSELELRKMRSLLQTLRYCSEAP